MPYVKRKTYRKYNKKTMGKKTLSNRALTSKVSKISREVKLNKVPFRAEVSNPTALNVYSTPQVLVLDVGLSANESPYHLKSIAIKGLLRQVTATADTEYHRFVLVKDNRKFDNDTAPVWSDIFDSSTVYTHREGTTDGTMSQPQKKSFTILTDKTYHTTKDADATLQSRKLINLSKSWKTPIKVFNTTGYQKNSIYLMYISTAATGIIDLDYSMRVHRQEHGTAS